jgi:uncharacterized repeat protein (TIGR01451 family)
MDIELAYTGPDVYVEKWLSSGEPRPGAMVTFLVEFGNRNNWWDGDDAVGSHITDTLPAAMDFVSAAAPWDPNWTPNRLPGNILEWGFGPMQSDSTWYFDIVVQITDTVGSREVLTNVISAYGDSPADVEPFWDNNSFRLPMTILSPVFEVGKVYEGARVSGTVVTYTLTVTNSGNTPGSNVVLSDTLPIGLTFAGSDGTLVSGDVIWNFPSIDADGGTVAAWFSATVACSPDRSIVNDRYLVVTSSEGASSSLGVAVSFDTVSPTITANFVQSANSILVSETVYFTGTATTNGTPITNPVWDFGDGSVGSGLNISHVFTRSNDYTVTFTVTDECGFNAQANGSVHVSLDCENVTDLGFDYAPASPLIHSPVTFTASISGGTEPITYTWQFDDGGSGNGPIVSHIFAQSGAHTITVTASNVCSALSFSDAIDIEPLKVFLPVVVKNH